MSQKLFLTSAIAMGFVAPAVAAPTYTSETFPTNGLMQEDYTYTNAATADNMDSVYEGSVNAVAEYEDIFYDIVAGNYLAAGSDDENGTICPAGSYCSGLTHAPYNATENQGITSCPTGYALSADGASSANECYRTCSGNVTIEHASGVTGNDYYGTGTDTCEPTGCVNGWHLKDGVNGTAIATAIGNEAGINSAYIKGDGTFSEGNYDGLGTKGQAYYGISDNMSWAVDYGDKGFLYGQARCSTRAGADNTWGGNPYTYNAIDSNFVSSLTDETGENGATICYCRVTGYKDSGGNLQSLNSPWLYLYSVNLCEDNCALNCVFSVRNESVGWYLGFRTAILGAIQSTPAMCEANTITINWSNADVEDISANNAGTATYGSDVRTPVKAETIKGKTFKGWRFSNPEKTNLSE